VDLILLSPLEGHLGRGQREGTGFDAALPKDLGKIVEIA